MSLSIAIVSRKTSIFVVVNAFMVNMVLVSAVLVLLLEASKWGKSFRLDELPEFSRNVLEVMRQPLEDRIISISRAKYSTEYPTSFMLVASMNPCPCGYYGHPKKKCVCNEYQRTHYIFEYQIYALFYGFGTQIKQGNMDSSFYDNWRLSVGGLPLKSNCKYRHYNSWLLQEL